MITLDDMSREAGWYDRRYNAMEARIKELEEERDRLLSVGFPREPKQAGGWTIQYNFLDDVKVAIEKESPDYVPSMEEIEAVLLVVEHLTTAST